MIPSGVASEQLVDTIEAPTTAYRLPKPPPIRVPVPFAESAEATDIWIPLISAAMVSAFSDAFVNDVTNHLVAAQPTARRSEVRQLVTTATGMERMVASYLRQLIAKPMAGDPSGHVGLTHVMWYLERMQSRSR